MTHPALADPTLSPAAEALWLPADGGALPPAPEIGGKAHNLGRLVAAGAPVPPFFVLRASAFAHPEGEAGGNDEAGGSSRELPAGLRAALAEALAGVAAGELVAVRSSAAAEDGAHSSFAGQFQTVLGVRPDPDEVWAAALRVQASAFSDHAREYRERRGEAGGGMAVVVQRMVAPAAAGVAFSVDPVSGDRQVAVVSAVPGLGEGLVGGELDADTFHVRFGAGGPRVTSHVVPKERAFRTVEGGGVGIVPVDPALRDQPALTDDEARRIAAAARSLAEAFGAPQDVEWALAPGAEGERTLYLLQTRPVTAIAPPAPRPAAGDRRQWDSENICESYPGVTLPLSYSVARRVFGDVYRQLCENKGIPAELVHEHAEDFRSLFGLIRGRVYYHEGHRDRIMAVLNDDAHHAPAAPPPPGSLPAPLLLASRALGVHPRMLHDTARLEELAADFRARVARELDPVVDADLSALPPDELVRLLDRLDDGLLRHWHGPMLNDGLVDAWMFVLQQMVQRWLPGGSAGLVNRLVAGEGGIVSTEPVRRLAELGARARADARLRGLLAAEGDDGESWRRLAADPDHGEFAAALRDYLARFGDRCADELKLEALSYRDDPGVLVRMLRRYAAAPQGFGAAPTGAELRAAAEAEVRAGLAPGYQVAFFAVLDRVRRLTRERENLRFERTRAFGVMRRVFLELGERLAAAGALAGPRDVLYLTEPELRDWLDGCDAGGSLRARVAARREEFAAYAELPDPPARVATHGPPALSPLEEVAPARGLPTPRVEGLLRGMGCCPGQVRAPVRVVRDPRDAGDLAGHILVALQTDPGWTLLFPAAAGVLVQRGSILSHAALVAREMGIPCVVGIPDLLATLRDGEVVEMDGATGIVRRVSTAAA